jgi:tRNA A37 threonylcarbamoyladenosine biosynthesis protein TsaE
LGGKGIVVTEWSELIDGAIPADAYRMRIEKAGETERKFTLC